MDLIRTIKDKVVSRKQQDMERRAEETLQLSDLFGKIYVAYGGVPIFPVEERWTTLEIVNYLMQLRRNYVTYMMKSEGCIIPESNSPVNPQIYEHIAATED